MAPFVTKGPEHNMPTHQTTAQTASDAARNACSNSAPKRVVVAMSGGVDSSLVAALLKRAGHDVIGITLQLYDHGTATHRKGACCAGQDIHDARAVAQAIDIPHYVLDYEKRFASSVIDAFADSYVAGETPIPCVTCNSQIKFKDLLETTKDLGAEILATGHYIKREDGKAGPRLVRAKDAERDQSYFLFSTTPEQLRHLWFPLGDMTKNQVRDLAHELNLPVASKADSQDICFVPSGRYTNIIERLRPDALKPGKIVHHDGRVLGMHDGIINFTIGQRRGLGIASGEPLYVIRLNANDNEVVVGPRELLETQTIILRDINWLGDTPLTDLEPDGLSIHARVRSTQPPQAATLHAGTDKQDVSVVLQDAANGIAPGQACVFYSDGSAQAQILGGGWIAATAA